MSPLSVGTCGWAYRDWEGVAYPKGLRAAERLGVYASTGLDLVELPAGEPAGPPRGAPARLRLALRLPDSAAEGPLKESLALLAAAGALGDRLACATAALPLTVKPSDAARERLRALRDAAGAIPFAAAPRAAEWAEERAWFRAEGIVLCATDGPRHPRLLPFLGQPTAELACLRLEGREPAPPGERPDCLYAEEELRAFAEAARRAAEGSRRVLVLFGNTGRGSAFLNAHRLAALLGLGVGAGRTPLRQPGLF